MTRRIDRLLMGSPPQAPGWRLGSCRTPDSESPILAIKRPDLVPWAAMSQAVAQARGPDDLALRARFGISPLVAAAIREGLVGQRIPLGGDAPPGPWARADWPSALEEFHVRAVRWFGSSDPSRQAAGASWVEHFPGLAFPSGHASARLRERALDWLGPASAPRRGAFADLRAMLADTGTARHWQAVVALARVRATALQRLSGAGAHVRPP